MSYYLGQSAIPVRPVKRRATLTRGQAPRNIQKYLQRKGRGPMNWRGYPTMGTPVPVDMSMEPGSQGLGRAHRRGLTYDYGHEMGRAHQRGMVSDYALGTTKTGPIELSVRTRAGRRFMVHPYDPSSSVFGQSILDPLSYTVAPVTEFLPSVPSVITAPAVSAPAPVSGFIGGIFDSAANFMKNISVSVDPLKTIQAVQQIIKPAQVGTLADQLRRFGINPAYMGLPITGTTAQYGYQAAGINWMAYLPWIAGGAALLFVVPRLMGGKR